jgi:hypothetical protein
LERIGPQQRDAKKHVDADPKPIVIGALVVFALSAAAAIFLVLELGRPFFRNNADFQHTVKQRSCAFCQDYIIATADMIFGKDRRAPGLGRPIARARRHLNRRRLVRRLLPVLEQISSIVSASARVGFVEPLP